MGGAKSECVLSNLSNPVETCRTIVLQSLWQTMYNQKEAIQWRNDNKSTSMKPIPPEGCAFQPALFSSSTSGTGISASIPTRIHCDTDRDVV